MIELIISLAMVAIIAASLSSTLWTAYHATRQAEAAVVPSDQADVAMQFLSEDLQNALQTQTNPASELVGTPPSRTISSRPRFWGRRNRTAAAIRPTTLCSSPPPKVPSTFTPTAKSNAWNTRSFNRFNRKNSFLSAA